MLTHNLRVRSLRINNTSLSTSSINASSVAEIYSKNPVHKRTSVLRHLVNKVPIHKNKLSRQMKKCFYVVNIKNSAS